MVQSKPTLTINTATTIDDLNSLSEIDDQTLRDLRNKSCNQIFDSLQRVYDKAQIYARSGDQLNAYVLSFRAATLCQIIQKSPEKNSFVHSPNGKTFMKVFELIIDDIRKLKKEVEMILTDRQMANELSNSIAIEDNAKIPDKPIPNEDPTVDGQISPRNIVAYAKKGKRVLILDYRAQSDVLIDFKGNPDGENIVVAQCPPSFIEESITIHQLSKILPIKERLKVDKIEHYDLVVFMDDEDPKRNPSTGQFLPPANYLMKGLTVYAYNRKLKRDPVFMKGGFTMWRHTYTIYTNQDFQQSAFNDDDDFGKYLNEYRKNNDVNVNYPDLRDGSRDPPWPTSTGQESKNEPITGIKWRQTPIPDAQPLNISKSTLQIQDNSQILPVKNSTTTTSFGVNADTPPMTKYIPIVDRSNKPNMQNPPNLPPPKSDLKSVSQVDVRGGNQNVNVPARPPPPQTNGYARPEPSSHIGFSPSLQQDRGRNGPKESSAPPRPPIPDRSTRPSSQEKEELINFYKRAWLKLYSNATKRQSEVGVGFVNMGNTCFMNTTLQALINSPGLREIFTKEKFRHLVNTRNKAGTKGVISAVFSALMDIYWSGDVSVILPDMFLKTFADLVNRSLADRRQHDAQEFQIYLMDALHEDTNEVYSRQGFQQDYDGKKLKKYAEDYEKKQKLFSFSRVSDLFNIRTVSIIKCQICGTSSATFEEMSQISLELDESNYQQLMSSLCKHFGKEILDNDCKWNCPQCKQPREATRETFIWKLPRNLVIHFKRFSQMGSNYVKNDANVSFDIDGLSLDQFVHPEARGFNPSYFLYAITNHSGSLNSGHYTSIVKGENRWYKYDDDYVSEVSRDSIMSSKAFVLFYTLRKNN